MAIDIDTRKPKLANVTGGLTGPAIKPIAIKLVWEAAKAVKIPIIGMGGIQNADDAIEFLMAGATAVAVGTANFYEPQTALQVIAGLRDFMARKKISDVREITGSVRTVASDLQFTICSNIAPNRCCRAKSFIGALARSAAIGLGRHRGCAGPWDDRLSRL